WVAAVHPEGNSYFFRAEPPLLRVVTGCNMNDPATAERVSAWVEYIQAFALEKGIIFTEYMELFIQLDDTDCQYYLADDSKLTVFWLESYESDDLGLLPVVSRSHMILQLQIQYWAHRESFPQTGIRKEQIEELIQVFAHGLADTMTSGLSTFPYEAEETREILTLLALVQNKAHERHTVVIAARFWGVIMYSRYENHHGQTQARLSRDTSIILSEEEEIQWTKTPIAVLTLGMAAAFNARLDSLFVDGVVYGPVWTSFMRYCMNSWKHSAIVSTGFIFTQIFSFVLPIAPILAYASAISAVLSILVAALLIHRHAELASSTATQAHDYLDGIISPSLKFQPAAAVFALPKALATLSFLVLCSQCIFVVAGLTGARQAMGVVAAAGGVLVSVFLATLSARVSIRWGGIFRLRSARDSAFLV
ncbi:hypothetical protein HYPSUDRAFT_148042, partial [Hypholoma sublateritium FD-334 SS-4]